MGKHSAIGSGRETTGAASGGGVFTPSPAELRRKRRIRIAIRVTGAALALAVVGSVVGAYAWFKNSRPLQAADAGAIGPILKPKLPGAPFYMVVMGEDKRPGEVRARSDTLMVAYLDPPRKRVTVISIPRDTRVSIPGHGVTKINSAAQIGGPKLTIETVKQLTGLPLSHYMAVDFNGFKDIVDAIGGITVDVPQRINDSMAADHNWKAKVVNKGPQKLDGAHALTFVRSRDYPQADLTRIKNQQIFLKALAKQTMELRNVLNAPKILTAVDRNVETDMTMDDMVGMAIDFRGIDSSSVVGVTMPGTPKYVSGVSYVIPDQDAMAAMVARLEAGESLAATTPAGSVPKTTVSFSSVTVTVRNGSGRTGLGASVADLLKKPGFKVPDVGNASKRYSKTVVVYGSEKAKAQAVRDELGKGSVVSAAGVYKFSTDVLVVIGSDWSK